MTTGETIGVVTGSIGAATGIIGLLVSIATYRRDRAKVRVTLRRDYQVTSGTDTDAVVRGQLLGYEATGEAPPEWLYYRDPDKTWALINVTNTGRRPIKIEKIGFITDQSTRQYHVLADFKATDIDEGHNAEQLFDQAKLAGLTVIGAFANDGTGRAWHGGISGIGNRVKAAIGLRPFQR